MPDALSLVFQHRSLVRRAVACATAGALLALLTLMYLAEKMGTVTSTPKPLVLGLYGLSGLLVGIGVRTFGAARRLNRRIVSEAS